MFSFADIVPSVLVFRIATAILQRRENTRLALGDMGHEIRWQREHFSVVNGEIADSHYFHCRICESLTRNC